METNILEKSEIEKLERGEFDFIGFNSHTGKELVIITREHHLELLNKQ